MSHPQLVEAIETQFVPFVVYNNQPGKDAELLRQFGEPAWNFQVIRFLNAKGEDIIPRKDRVWTLEGVSSRMIETLQKEGIEVPAYLEALSGTANVEEVGQAAFAMFCFWTGEQKLGGLDGVLTTEAGWLEGREVTLVQFDRSRLTFERLLSAAVSFDCARKVYTTNQEDTKLAAASRLAVGPLSDGYKPARESDQKKQLSGTPFQRMNLSPVQATKVNAYARSDANRALGWLSPRQIEELRKS